MKRSGDLVIGRSGDRKSKFIAETRRRGEESSQTSTTEARRHGEESGDVVIARAPVVEKHACCNHPNFVTRSFESQGSYQGTGFSRAVKDKNIWASAPAVLKSFIQTLRATLREIFDESAYDRFLLRTSKAHSAASYRDFTRERDAAMVKKPRCC
jgi:hypothetical protein